MVAKNPDQAGLMKSRVRSWVEQIQKGSPDSNPKPREAHRLRTEFCERSARQRFHRHKTTTRSSIAKRILKTLHAPARPPGRNHEMVVDHDRHSPDVSRQRGHPAKITRRSSITNRRFTRQRGIRPKPREGRRKQTEFRERSTARVLACAQRHSGSGSTGTKP